MSMTHCLEVRNVRVALGGVRVLDDVSFTVPHGAMTALVGPNGAGKTTLLDVITRLTPADSGDVVLNGCSLAAVQAHRLAAMGLMRSFQSTRLVQRLSARENAMLGAHHMARSRFLAPGLRLPGSLRDESLLRGRADAALALLSLGAVADASVHELPTSTQRIVMLAVCLAGAPRVLLLDEISSGLDIGERDRVEEAVRTIHAGGTAVVMVEHDLELVGRLCDSIVVLEAGTVIAAGEPSLIHTDPVVRRAYLGAA